MFICPTELYTTPYKLTLFLTRCVSHSHRPILAPFSASALAISCKPQEHSSRQEVTLLLGQLQQHRRQPLPFSASSRAWEEARHCNMRMSVCLLRFWSPKMHLALREMAGLWPRLFQQHCHCKSHPIARSSFPLAHCQAKQSPVLHSFKNSRRKGIDVFWGIHISDRSLATTLRPPQTLMGQVWLELLGHWRSIGIILQWGQRFKQADSNSKQGDN